MRSRRPLARSAAGLVFVSLFLAACGNGGSPAANEAFDTENAEPPPHPDELAVSDGDDQDGEVAEPLDPSDPSGSPGSPDPDDLGDDPGPEPDHPDQDAVANDPSEEGTDGDHSDEADPSAPPPSPDTPDAEDDDPGAATEHTDERIIVVGGPTLNNDYPEYWGNLYSGDQCAVFTLRSDHDVTLESVTVEEPLSLVTDCEPNSRVEVTSRGCESGIVFSSEPEASCLFGVQLPDDRLDTDFTPKNTWTFSVLCSDTLEPPCSEVDTGEQHLLTEEGVRVYWTVVHPMRWCGASDYGPLTAAGEPVGPGESHPVHGCVVGTSSDTDSSKDPA